MLSVALLSQAKQSECGTVHFLGLESFRTLYNTPQLLDVSIVNETSLEANWNRRTGRQTDGKDRVLSQADAQTKNEVNISNMLNITGKMQTRSLRLRAYENWYKYVSFEY